MSNELSVEDSRINETYYEIPDNEYHYVGIMFESKYGSSVNNPKFYGKVYEYKTKRDLKEGQVIVIDTRWGKSRVCVIKENIPVEQLEFEGGVENLAEI